MRQLQVLALVLVAAVVAASDQPFTAAEPNGTESFSPEGFSFTLRTWKCTVSREGVGTCRDGSRKWAFRLPVDDGRIDSLHFNAGETCVFVYTLTDEESDWGKAVGLMPRERRPRWATQIAGLNRALPIAAGRSVLVGALGFIGSIDPSSGEFVWRHDFVYDGSGRTDIKLEMNDGVVAITAAVPWRLSDSVTVCYSVESGVVVNCPPKPVV